MSKGHDLNVFSATGRLGAAPEITYSESGQAIARLTLASHDYRRDDHEVSGYRQETSWIPLLAFGWLAERAERDGLGKGSMLAVAGRLRVYKYLDRTGATRTGFEVILSDYTLLSQSQLHPLVQEQPEAEDEDEDNTQSQAKDATHRVVRA